MYNLRYVGSEVVMVVNDFGLWVVTFVWREPDVLEEYVASRLILLPPSAGFLLGLLFDLEDGGSMFL
jgi:hypothetical protein